MHVVELAVLYQFHVYYHNSFINYLIAEINMRRECAFGTRMCVAEAIMKALVLGSFTFLLSHISVYHRALVGNTSSEKWRKIEFLAEVIVTRKYYIPKAPDHDSIYGIIFNF